LGVGVSSKPATYSAKLTGVRTVFEFEGTVKQVDPLDAKWVISFKSAGGETLNYLVHSPARTLGSYKIGESYQIEEGQDKYGFTAKFTKMGAAFK
jgi:hypothetical protein